VGVAHDRRDEAVLDRDGERDVGRTMTLTLSCDHRVVDGAVGAAYLNALKALLEGPALLLV
jgi:pyruvate dehydrogenase E2 component (dihydrolipoamide acetyltransferase)